MNDSIQIEDLLPLSINNNQKISILNSLDNYHADFNMLISVK